MHLVAVEGNVCAGKNAFMERMAAVCARHEIACFQVPKPPWWAERFKSNPILAMFLLWHFQVTALSRLPRHAECIVLLETTPFSYRLCLPKTTELSADEMTAIRALSRNPFIPSLPAFRTAYVFSTPEVCFDRCFRRDGEQALCRESIDDFHARLHDGLMRTSPFLVSDTTTEACAVEMLRVMGLHTDCATDGAWQTVRRKKARCGYKSDNDFTGNPRGGADGHGLGHVPAPQFRGWGRHVSDGDSHARW